MFFAVLLAVLLMTFSWPLWFEECSSQQASHGDIYIKPALTAVLVRADPVVGLGCGMKLKILVCLCTPDRTITNQNNMKTPQ